MPTSAQMRYLLAHPKEMMLYQASGRLPRGSEPRSPLISLLEDIGVGFLGQIIGLVVGERLGYAGQRKFANASQALRWIKPSTEVFGTFPAESYRLNSFSGPLFIDDIVDCCDSFPGHVLDRCRHLRSAPRATHQSPRQPRALGPDKDGPNEPNKQRTS